MINLLRFNFLAIAAVLFSGQIFSQTTAAMTLASLQLAQAEQDNQTIKGQSGGEIDSQGCGFIASKPSYEMNLGDGIDYMRLTVQASGGQPTLLVLGPNAGDSFCVLGDEISGLKPEISGVWEPGKYQIFVGDRTGESHQFTLDISVDN